MGTCLGNGGVGIDDGGIVDGGVFLIGTFVLGPGKFKPDDENNCLVLRSKFKLQFALALATTSRHNVTTANVFIVSTAGSNRYNATF